jgi:hypothetical protein
MTSSRGVGGKYAWAARVRVAQSIRIIPWQGMEGMEPAVIGRRLTLDGVIEAGKHEGEYLSQVNSHYIAIMFIRAVEHGESATILQLLWDYGIALLTRERIHEQATKPRATAMNESPGERLVSLWAMLAHRKVDLGEEFWTEMLQGSPADPETIMNVIEGIGDTYLS